VVHGQGLGLAARRVQGAHEQGPGALGRRVGGGERANLPDQARALAQGQVGLDPVGQHAGVQLRQPGRGYLGRVAPGRVGQRLTAPRLKRGAQHPRGRLGVAFDQRPAPLDGSGLEDGRVHGVGRHGQAVPGRVRLDHRTEPGPAEFGPQPGDQSLQRVAGVAGCLVGPQLFGQRAGRHDTPGVQRQQNKQNAQLTAADGCGVPGPVPHLKRAEHPDTQRVWHQPSPVIRLLARTGTRAPGPFNARLHLTLPAGFTINRRHGAGRRRAR
jgi:hypothetical protein